MIINSHTLRLTTLATLIALSGCASTTTANAPGEFAVVHSGPYDAAKQAQMVDCVFDGFLGSQSVLMATQVRQIKRANGWRIDIIAESRQFMAAEIKDDGQYALSRTYNAVPLDKEIAASRACLQRFGTIAAEGAPQYRPGQAPGGYNAPLVR